MKLVTNSSAFLHCFGLVAFSFSLGACGATSDDQSTSSTESALQSNDFPEPPIPPALAVPEGNRFQFAFGARGTQLYPCLQTFTGAYEFGAAVPRASLFNSIDQEQAIHYTGPTWQMPDGSAVVGSKIAAVTPDPKSIPWLLLKAVSHTGAGLWGSVSYIQRVATVGGNPPAGGCNEMTEGSFVEVPYTATYEFYLPGSF